MWARVYTCEHPWTMCVLCTHSCVESYVAGSGRDWKPGRLAVAQALFSASPSLVHCLFTCVVLESTEEPQRIPPTELFRKTAMWGGRISGPCV